MPGNPPHTLVATVISPYRINFSWINGENDDPYQNIQVWRKIATGDYEKIDDIPAYKTSYEDGNLTPETLHCYYVIGEWWEPPGETDASNEECKTTFAELEDPTDLVVEAFADFIELTFKDNSSAELEFRIDRKVGTGEWVINYAQVETNMDYYKDTTGITPGEKYTYRVYGWDGAPSGWSNEDSAIALSVSSVPSGLAISEKSVDWMRLNWTDIVWRGQWITSRLYHVNDSVENDGKSYTCIQEHTSDVDKEPGALLPYPPVWDNYWEIITGYKVQQCENSGFTGETLKTFVIGAGITEYLAGGLSAGTPYWFRICSYNGVGDSAFCGSVTDTTLTAYVPTDFEKFIRNPKIEIVALCEINPGKEFSGFAPTDGKTYTYELAITDRAIVDFERVYGNGEEYAKRSSINEVEASPSSFWFNTVARKIYVHTSTGANPSGFYIEGRFWIYFSNKEDITFNGNFYLPFLSLENIPSMNSEINAFYGGSFKIASGTISLKNDEETSKKFFDKRFADYLWSDAKLILKIGKEGFVYSKYEEAFTSLVGNASCNDRLISLNLKDLRANLGGRIPVNRYHVADFPDMDEEKEDAVIPRVFLCGRGIPAVCVNKENKKWSFHDGRIKEVNTVKVNGTLKTKDTHYYVDYKRAIVTFDAITMAGMDWEKDTVDIEFTGTVDSANEAVTDGAEIFKSIMNEIMGLSNDELDHDSIYGTKYDTSLDLSVQIYKEENLAKIINKIENSVRASTFQDEKGRIGLRVAQAAPALNAVYVENFHISEDGHGQEKGTEFLFKEINIYYAEDPGKEKPEVFTKPLPKFVWKYGKRKPLKSLDIDTYFIIDTAASALADDIATKLEELEAGFIHETLPWVLYGCRAGDIIKLSRDRFYGSLGTADKINVRLLKLDKAISSRKSIIKGVIVT